MSRKGVGRTAPFSMTRTVPCFSTTNSRPPVSAWVMAIGESSPLATCCKARVNVVGLNGGRNGVGATGTSCAATIGVEGRAVVVLPLVTAGAALLLDTAGAALLLVTAGAALELEPT